MTDMNASRGHTVVIVAPNMKQYREAFYLQLAEALARSGVSLRVLYSTPDPVEAAKGDNVDLPAPLGRRIPRQLFLANRVLVQWPPLRLVAGADLVVVVQASGYLLNYPMLALSAMGLKRVAFWGHGWNHQGDPRSPSERLKKRLARVPDWWFSYTQPTARYLASIGMDPARITVVENAVDTRKFRSTLEGIREDEAEAMRARLSLAAEDVVALYCGALYREKRIGVLLEAARQVAAAVPGFRLLIVGAGSESGVVREHAQRHDWVRYAGPLFGREKAICFRLAQVVLNPGGIGLGILDSFAAGLPLVTMADARHGPEMAYLEHDRNGLVVEGDASSLAHEVISLVADPHRLRRLSAAAAADASRHTIEGMVANFERGVLACLGIPKANGITTCAPGEGTGAQGP